MRIKRPVAVFFATALLAVSLVNPAGAQQQFIGDGLVNVQIGDVEVLNDVTIGAAVNAVVQACDAVDADVVAGIIADIDQGDRKSATFCKVETGQVKVTQNRG